jgi:hypothetical protein
MALAIVAGRRREDGCKCARCAKAGSELEELWNALGDWRDTLFDAQATAAPAGPESAPSVRTVHMPGPADDSSGAVGPLAAAALLALVVGLGWILALTPISRPAATMWRGTQQLGVSVRAEASGDEVRFHWDSVDGASWYRVAVYTRAGTLISRSDTEDDCPCALSVSLPALPGSSPSLHWLVEAFDGDWARLSATSGTVTRASQR